MDFNYIDRNYIYSINKNYTPEIIEICLEECKYCTNIINSTDDINLFFETYMNLINMINQLIPVEKKLKFNGIKPSAFKQIMIEKEILTINDFFNRFFKTLKNDLLQLKRYTTKENRLKDTINTIDEYSKYLKIENKRYYEDHINKLIDKYEFKIKKYGYIFCNYCGKQITLNSNFCIYCGNNIYTKVKINTPKYNAPDKQKILYIEDKYSKIIHQHSENVKKINLLYSLVNNLTTPNSKEMENIILLCLEDIRLAPEYSNYIKEISVVSNEKTEKFIINYISFQKLAIIYEKQGKLEEAIDICKYAIQLGFYKDGTAGQMPGRLARLVKKSRKDNKQLN